MGDEPRLGGGGASLGPKMGTGVGWGGLTKFWLDGGPHPPGKNPGHELWTSGWGHPWLFCRLGLGGWGALVFLHISNSFKLGKIFVTLLCTLSISIMSFCKNGSRCSYHVLNVVSLMTWIKSSAYLHGQKVKSSHGVNWFSVWPLKHFVWFGVDGSLWFNNVIKVLASHFNSIFKAKTLKMCIKIPKMYFVDL